MAAAWLLTLLAWAGVAGGLFLGQWRRASSHLATVGGVLLFAIAVFLVIPEVAQSLGWVLACGLAIGVCAGLMQLDRYLSRPGRCSPEGVIGPLLAATALHSFLDGWSVRAFSALAFATIAVPLGLALHKLPEGLALGLITRKAMPSIGAALITGILVEGLTLLGAIVEPRVNESGAATFGNWWTGIVLAIVGGSFLFLGVHSFVPHRGKT